MSDPENKDQVNPDYYMNTQHIEHIEEDEHIKPPIDVTPPIDQSPNLSGQGEPEILPEPEKPGKKGLFGKKDKQKKEKKEKPPKQKKDKKSGGDSGGEGAANKLKGLFKKNKKDDTNAIQIIDNTDNSYPAYGDTGTQQTSVPGTPEQPVGYTGYPGFRGSEVPTYPSTPPQSTSAQSGPYGKKPVSSYMRRPPPNYQKEGCAEVKEPPKKSLFRCSNIIVVVLICGCIAGIIMTALAGGNIALEVIGPFFIGASLFTLIGKIFLTLFWNKEAHPMIKPAAKAINKKMKAGPNYQQQQHAMSTYNYPRSSAYNQAYDTTLQGPPDALTSPTEYISEDDFAPYNSTSPNYHEEPMPEDYGYGAENGQYQIDMKEEDDYRKAYDEVDIKKGLDDSDIKKDYDEGGDARFI